LQLNAIKITTFKSNSTIITFSSLLSTSSEMPPYIKNAADTCSLKL